MFRHETKMAIFVKLTLILLSLVPQGAITGDTIRTQADRALGTQDGLPQFSQYRVRSSRVSRQGWLSIGRCDQAIGQSYESILRQAAKNQMARFAGHYLIAVCSCGTGCSNLSIIDTSSRRIHLPRIGALSPCMSDATSQYSDFIYFRLNSSLLITVGDISRFDSQGRERGVGCAVRYYHWTGSRLILLRKVALQSKSQPN